MAASISPAKSFFDPNSCGTWERIFWERGPDAAMAYCEKKAARLKEIHRVLWKVWALTFTSTDIDHEILRELETCHLTFLRYQKDMIYLDPRTYQVEVIHRGKGEPGRTPFNFPDFRKRFYFEDELFAHISRKILRHERGHLALSKCLEMPQISALGFLMGANANNVTIQDRLCLARWDFVHLSAIKKWSNRLHLLNTRPDLVMDWLLPVSLKENLELMKFQAVHKDKVLGEGAVGFVFEYGLDETHSKLISSVENHIEKTCSLSDVEHGTFVSGIIAKAAPRAKIKVYSNGKYLDEGTERIINFSAWFADDLSSLSAYPEALHTHTQFCYGEQSLVYKEMQLALSLPTSIKQVALRSLAHRTHVQASTENFGDLKGSLLIQSIGNRGVLLDRNPLVEQGHYWISKSLKRMSRCIFVVCLDSNGLFPNPCSCLPGKKYAAMTICAIGTDVYSTCPADQFGYQSGSSFSAPFVTSVALLIRGKYPELSLKQIRQCILKGATPIVIDELGRPQRVKEIFELLNYSSTRIQRSREIYGVGLLNAERSLNLAGELASKSKLKSLAKKQRTQSS
ncbi:MAG: S8 family serine peptidase [Rhabdochlamydiaceae bacterium]|nr:S8 family serine peptidase [Rhabdochlamydiaceae bacterium]